RWHELLLGGDNQLRPVSHHLQQRTEALDGQQLRYIRAGRGFPTATIVGRAGGRRARLPANRRLEVMLARELGRRADLDHLDIPKRSLREGREPAQRLDFEIEHIDANRPFLGRRKHVEEAPTERELTPLLDLVGALVTGRDELRRTLLEIE